MNCARCSKPVLPSTGLLVVNEDDTSETFVLCQRDTYTIAAEMSRDLTSLIKAMRDSAAA